MKKQKNKQGIKASKLAKAENKLKHQAEQMITVKNAEGEPDTQAKILIQNKVNYTPKVSVIIPVYNVEEYLRECLDSVINQTLKEIEIICVDDGSTDNSLEILKEYAKKDNRISVLTQENLHAGVARNAGLAVAQGEYLSFLDSDDFFELIMLEETYKVAKTENSDLTFYQYKNYNNETQQAEKIAGINKQFPVNEKGYAVLQTTDIATQLFTICNPMPWNKLISHQLVKQEQLSFQSLPASNDVYFSQLILAYSQKIVFWYKSFVYYRYNRKNSLKNSRDKYPLNFAYAYQGIYNILKNKNLYETYQKTFLTSYLSTALWTVEHTDKARQKVKDFIKERIILEFSILTKNKNIFSDYMISRIKRVYEPDIIISLTSYPARIGTVNQTIESLLNQTMKADKVILWLAPEQFPNKEKELPEQLLALCDKGLTIDWYHDIKSYKKLIPTLKKYPEAIIVTADDDAIYDIDWLIKLHEAYLKKPNEIHCHRAHRLKTKRKEILSYKKWEWFNILKPGQDGFDIFFTGLGGVLYPPNSLDIRVLNEEKFSMLCPSGDDIWFWGHALLKGTKINLISGAIKFPKLIPGTQETALWHQNIEYNKNDTQMKSLVSEYPQLLKTLKSIQNKRVFISYVKFLTNLLYFNNLTRKFTKIFIEKNILQSRIDIKNFGKENNAVDIKTNAQISHPAWFVNIQGQGQVVESNKNYQDITIRAIQDGKLVLSFKGQDKRFEGVRFPVWIDYKSIKIDGKEILSAPIATWHDKPFRYEKPVKDGQIVKVEVVQQYHQYSKDELKDVILKLNPNSDYINENVEELTNKIYTKIVKYKVSHISQLPIIEADYFIPLGNACRPAFWLKKYGLRQASYPFDWMMSYSLSTVINTITKGCHDWFSNYTEDKSKINAKVRYVVDNTNHIISMHGFPSTCSVDAFLPEFQKTMQRRIDRLKGVFSQSRRICILCNRDDTLDAFIMFGKELNKMYPHLNITIINVVNANTRKDIEKYDISKKLKIYLIMADDTNEKGSDKTINPKFWIGNERLYEEICSKFKIVKSSPQTTLFAKVKQNVQEKIKLWQDKLSFAHKIELVVDLMQKNQTQTLKLLQEIQAKNTNLENKNNELQKQLKEILNQLSKLKVNK